MKIWRMVQFRIGIYLPCCSWRKTRSRVQTLCGVYLFDQHETYLHSIVFTTTRVPQTWR